MSEGSSAVAKLKKTLEDKELKDTHAYKIILHLEKDITPVTIDVLHLLQHLGNLLEVYRLAPENESLQETVGELEKIVNNTKPKLLAYHLSLENLKKTAKKMTTEKQHAVDLDTLQKVGIFYVLEYTLQVLFEFQSLSDEEKNKLLDSGLQTKTGNLPAYLPLEETFKKELCYRIYDDKLRRQLLEAFYKWEEELYNENRDLKKLNLALKQFNLALLNAFNEFGFTKFKAAIYAPWGNNLSTNNLIKKIEILK